MQTRRQTLKQSAVVAGLLAGTGLFPQYAHAFNKAAFDAKTLGDALKALGASGAPEASGSVSLTAPDIAENGAVVPLAVASSLPNVKQLVLL
ncbi:MAG TPA: thiosulfate oxidation carrier protein SoxY, partial [Ottowia sp.]|nr:thiosulfate oxidation carrier protein SoxY [Ottowia sp.]